MYGMILFVCLSKSRNFDHMTETSTDELGLGNMCICFRGPLLFQKSAWFCQPWCTPVLQHGGYVSGWPMCQCCWGPVFSPGSVLPLTHFILLLLLPCGTQGNQGPDWATLAWPGSIPPTTLITSQMVIDEASLAALTPLKYSQTYIRGATDRSVLLPSKAGLHRELGARFANYSCSSTLLPCTPHAPSRQLSSHHQCCSQTGLPSNTGQTTQAC